MTWRFNIPKSPVSPADRGEFMKIIYPIESVGMRGANKQAHDEHASMLVPSSVSTPTQDATALADELRRCISQMPGISRSNLMVRVEAFLRAAPQTPDATSRIRARRLDTGLRNKWEAQVDKIPVGRAASEAGALKIAEQKLMALSTRSASAGPQSEAVAIFPALDAAQEALNLGAAIRYLRETPLSKFDPKHLIVLIALVQSRLEAAHPQPQQADGRGAVSVEQLEDLLCEAFSNLDDDQRVHNGYVMTGARAVFAALQQSPATDNAPAVSSRAQERET